MAVARQQLCRALDVVEAATSDLVADGTFHHGVLTRLRQTKWPLELMDLAKKIGRKASAIKEPTSQRGMNGVTLDQRGKASLESLVLHYAERDPALFSPDTVRTVRKELAGHRGPKFHGPWP